MDELADALATSGGAVLVSPPGSGKTTLVPIRLLEKGIPGRGKTLMLEPRRLPTRAAARRMAHLLGEEVGETVGYVTRDDRRTGPTTRIEVVTEGVLTRRLQRDPELEGVGLVIFDEFHERNLQTDLGLAFTLDARASLRPDLAVLIMSATLDADRIGEVLGAPSISAQGSLHPVDIRWRPAKRQTRLEDHVVSTVLRSLDTDLGDILVFLPGIGEIERVAGKLEGAGVGCEIHRLHGSLPVAEQDAAVSPTDWRKVVLSTDIAESSLTVEGVSVVIDSGLARAPRFDPRTGMTRLQTISISRASADQRSGRAGRLGPGVTYRLWSKVEHGTRKAHIEPEIVAVDLARFMLELKLWGVGSPAQLTFLDQPGPRAVEEAMTLLERLGAVDQVANLTPIGREMAALPLHPRLAHMVAAAGPDAGLACVLAALIDERDPFRGPRNELPVDIAQRVEAVAGRRGHRLADRRGLDRVRRTAEDLGRRVGADIDDPAADRSAAVLALAFPDRLAVRRGTPGRFQLRTGQSAWIPSGDELAASRFLVVADIDGKRKDARIRLAAALDETEVESSFSSDVESSAALRWVDARLVERLTTRIGGVVLSEVERRPPPGADVAAAFAARIRREPSLLFPESSPLRQRVAFARTSEPDEGWPDWSEQALLAILDERLAHVLGGMTSIDDLRGLDVDRLLGRELDHRLRQRLDSRFPTHVTLGSGRHVAVDYSGDEPSISAPVQDFFGMRSTPEIGGRPLVVVMLSPARRPVQVTKDLAGFWEGSWQEVRKEMAGRYPKHAWPENP